MVLEQEKKREEVLSEETENLLGREERNGLQAGKLSLAVGMKRSSKRQEKKSYWREPPFLSPLIQKKENSTKMPVQFIARWVSQFVKQLDTVISRIFPQVSFLVVYSVGCGTCRAETSPLKAEYRRPTSTDETPIVNQFPPDLSPQT
jgi:hypothetical protein